MRNLYPTGSEKPGDMRGLLGRDLSKLVTRLDALLLVLKSCQGVTCIQPWEALQPNAQVHNLQDALEERHDMLYDSLPRVSFDWCDDGYLLEAEGPQLDLHSPYGGSWDIWV